MRYTVSAVGVTADPDPQTLINLFSIAGNARAKIYEIITSSGATPDDQSALIECMRTTANGTELAGMIPNPLDPDGNTSAFDSGNAHTVEPTETALSRLLAYSQYLRATYRWVAAPGSELIIPATTNAGINVVRRASTSAHLMTCTILFEE